MAIPESVKEKIRALSLKTVENGASEAEQATARDMIRRLYEKYDVKVEQPSRQEHGVSYKEALEVFRSHRLQSFLKGRLSEVDWDSIAKQVLTDQDDYYDYLQETHPWWEKRERTKRGMVRSTDAENYMTESDYRIKCFEAFTKIYEERK